MRTRTFTHKYKRPHTLTAHARDTIGQIVNAVVWLQAQSTWRAPQFPAPEPETFRAQPRAPSEVQAAPSPPPFPPTLALKVIWGWLRWVISLGRYWIDCQ